MSQIEKIGTALFGQSWMAQVANVLTNSNGESLSRQTVQSTLITLKPFFLMSSRVLLSSILLSIFLYSWQVSGK